MDGGDGEIEAREQGFVEVERAVLEDVDLGPGEDAELRAALLAVPGGDLLELGGEAFLVEPAGLRLGFRVVGDAQVLQA